MTFDDDFIQLQTESGPRRFACKENGIEWPPPPIVSFLGFNWYLVGHSEITDEQRAGMTRVCRGAAYSDKPQGDADVHGG